MFITLFFISNPSQQINNIGNYRLKLSLRCQASIFCHRIKAAVDIVEKILWRVKLFDFSGIEDQDLVAVHDGLQPVSDGEDGAVLELLPDRRLNQIVRFKVNCSCGFVKYQYFGFS